MQENTPGLVPMKQIREIEVEYCKNPNFEPTGENIVRWECDSVEYYIPTIPMPIGYSLSNVPIGPIPSMYNLIRNDTGECVQITPYQVISIYYKTGYPERVAEAVQKRMEYEKKVLDTARDAETKQTIDATKHALTEQGSYV